MASWDTQPRVLLTRSYMDYFSHYHSDCIQIRTLLGRLVSGIGVRKAKKFNKAGKATGTICQ